MPVSIDKIIAEAIAKGELDNLKGKGKPLEKDQLANVPEEQRMYYRVLKNAGYKPQEVEIKNVITELREQLKKEEDPEKKKELSKKIVLMEAELNIKLDALRK